MIEINELRQNTICEKAIFTYGHKHQKQKAIEELGELIEALTFALNGSPNNANEEIADVEIMLCQLKMMYRVPSTNIRNYIEESLNKYLILNSILLMSRLIQDISRDLNGLEHEVTLNINYVECLINKLKGKFNAHEIEQKKEFKLDRLYNNIKARW